MPCSKQLLRGCLGVHLISQPCVIHVLQVFLEICGDPCRGYTLHCTVSQGCGESFCMPLVCRTCNAISARCLLISLRLFMSAWGGFAWRDLLPEIVLNFLLFPPLPLLLGALLETDLKCILCCDIKELLL